MVSLRSGSTTGNVDIGGPAEVSSKRTSRRPATKKDSRLAVTKSNEETPKEDVTASTRKITRTSLKILAPIAEAPQSETFADAGASADNETVRTPQQKPAAPCLPYLTNQQSLDTPAKHTRARSRQEPHASALKPSKGTAASTPARQAAPGSSKKPLQSVRRVHKERDTAPNSAQTSEEPGTSSGHNLRSADAAAAVMGPVRGVALHNGDGEASSADSESEEAEHGSASEAAGSGGSGDSEGSDEADSASSDSEGSENVGRGVRLNAEAAAESDEDESSASWSSEEGDDENEGDLNSMAQNMLAALQSMDGRRPAAIGTALEAAHSGGAPDLAEEDVEELRWEPAVKLPEPIAPGDGAGNGSGSVPLHGAIPLLGNQLMAPPVDPRRRAREARKAAPDTAGKGWFDLPAQQITPEVKRDLRLIRLRGAMDTKRFYKSLDSTKFPKYFQFGTVVEGPADFYAGRMTKKQRQGTLTDELLADPDLAEGRAKRYGRLQEERGRFARKKKRPTGNERKRVVKRPRH